MKQEEKFEIAVAAFEALLGKNKLWEEYLLNFNKYNPHGHSEGIYTNWKQWAVNIPPYRWIASAFIWEDTRPLHYAWKELDYMWLVWICENLNN